jgi:glutathione S-transferase
VLRHLNPAMKILEEEQIAPWGELNKPRVTEFLTLLDRELGSHRYLAGDQFSVADITGLVAIDVMKPAKLAVPDQMANVRRWHADVAARPSAPA